MQLADRLRGSVQSGELRPGDPIPSEHQLCRTYDVSRPTVRRAIDVLVEEGLLVKRRGMGTFVAKLRLEQPTGRVIGFSERMRRNGLVPSTRVLELHVVLAKYAGPEVATALRLASDARVLRLSRLRLANDEPLVLETVHMPLDRFDGLEQENLETSSLYQILRERFGTEVKYIRETLEPVLLTVHEATMLRTQVALPGMLARILTFDRNGDPIEHSTSLVRGDRCQYEIELGPDGSAGGAWSVRQTQLEVELS
jgi:GntR family transcriptional regulator